MSEHSEVEKFIGHPIKPRKCPFNFINKDGNLEVVFTNTSDYCCDSNNDIEIYESNSEGYITRFIIKKFNPNDISSDLIHDIIKHYYLQDIELLRRVIAIHDLCKTLKMRLDKA